MSSPSSSAPSPSHVTRGAGARRRRGARPVGAGRAPVGAGRAAGVTGRTRLLQGRASLPSETGGATFMAQVSFSTWDTRRQW